MRKQPVRRQRKSGAYLDIVFCILRSLGALLLRGATERHGKVDQGHMAVREVDRLGDDIVDPQAAGHDAAQLDLVPACFATSFGPCERTKEQSA